MLENSIKRSKEERFIGTKPNGFKNKKLTVTITEQSLQSDNSPTSESSGGAG